MIYSTMKSFYAIHYAIYKRKARIFPRARVRACTAYKVAALDKSHYDNDLIMTLSLPAHCKDPQVLTSKNQPLSAVRANLQRSTSGPG